MNRAEKRRAKKEEVKKAKVKSQAILARAGKGQPNPKRRLSLRRRLLNLERTLLRVSAISGGLGAKWQEIEDIFLDLTIDKDGRLVAGSKLEEWYAAKKEAAARESAGDDGGEAESQEGDGNPQSDVSEGAEETEAPTEGEGEEGEAVAADDASRDVES